MTPLEWQPETRRRPILPIVAAVLLSTVGLVLAAVGFLTDRNPTVQAKVSIAVKLRGQGNRPIDGSEIWISRPQYHFLGTTNRQGEGSFVVELPRGQLAILEARGATFKITRELLIPNLPEYALAIALDPDEARRGSMTIESVTNSNKDNRALEAYSDAVSAKQRERSRLAIGTIKVATAPPEEQPPLTSNERNFLQKLVPAFERGAKTIRYSLLAKKTHLIVLRLLRGGQSISLEIRLFDTNKTLIGARLVDAPTLKPNMINPLLTEALEASGRVLFRAESEFAWDHTSSPDSPPQQSPLNLSPRDTLLKIRKRPVDDILVFANGHLTQLVSNRDFVHARITALKNKQQQVTIAATGQSGLMVVKSITSKGLPQVLEWSWPEWKISGRTLSNTP